MISIPQNLEMPLIALELQNILITQLMLNTLNSAFPFLSLLSPYLGDLRTVEVYFVHT